VENPEKMDTNIVKTKNQETLLRKCFFIAIPLSFIFSTPL